MPFSHTPVGGQGNLVADKIQSPNYVPATSGWQVAQDGSAEFNDLTVLGNVTVETNDGGVFIYGYQPG